MLTGRFGCLQDREPFKGKEIVARQLTTQNLHIAEGSKVVVIGSAKTALDVAGAAAEVAETVTVLARKVSLVSMFKAPCMHLSWTALPRALTPLALVLNSTASCPGPHSLLPWTPRTCPGPQCLWPSIM